MKLNFKDTPFHSLSELRRQQLGLKISLQADDLLISKTMYFLTKIVRTIDHALSERS